MNYYLDIIQDVLTYIDQHLTNSMNAGILANRAGFSTYHFCRVFQWYTGYSVMEYVRLRRLSFAASELSSGRKLIDIAMDYGYETHSGFSKAFKRQYGVPPEIYRMRARPMKPPLPDILRMKTYSVGGIVMEPKFVTLPEIKLAGYQLRTRNIDGENNRDIPAFWTSYMADGSAQRLHEADFIRNHDEYGACFAEDPENGEFIYVIGLEVREGAAVSEGFYTCGLPPATYAVFSTPPSGRAEFSATIQGTWVYIMSDWFPESGYEYAPGCVDFEFYAAKNMGEQNNICDIYIPVVKK